MFGVTAVSGSSVDPDQERPPPPAPTLIYFPQNDLDSHDFHTDEDWAKHIPNLMDQYGHITKPADIKLEHLRALNVSIDTDVDLDQLLPTSIDGYDYLPPPPPADPSARRKSSARTPSISVNGQSSAQKNPILSNGHKAPDHDLYFKYVAEMTVENEDGFRAISRRKARSGHPTPNFANFRRFWSSLELISSYWDTSLDHYYEVHGSDHDKHAAAKSAKGFKRLSIALNSLTQHEHAPVEGQRYKGRRVSTGAKMPEQFRIDMIRALVEPLSWAFGCFLLNPKKTPQMEIGKLRLPVTQTAVVWRSSQDKAQSKKGITEGPLLGIQCRNETAFLTDKNGANLDTAREIAGLFLIAEERSREGKAPRVPGEGEWYTTKPRWGGGPGGEFGDKEENTDQAPPTRNDDGTTTSTVFQSKRHVPNTTIRYVSKGKTEEQIWKELKPSPSLWDPRHTYLAVGKDRSQPFDNVFMVSALFHHIAILKLTVHPLYMDFMVSGRAPANTPPNVPWYKPKIERTRWYDLLDPADRGEIMRGLWGVMAYLMRAGDNADVHSELGRRQKSDSHQHHFSFRKKSASPSPARSSSVAF